VRRPPARRRPAVAVGLGLVVVAILLLTGCTTVRGLLDTEQALDRAGYTDIDVGFSTEEGFDQVEITLRPEIVGEDPAEEAERAADVVWDVFPLQFDLLRIEFLGPAEDEAHTFTYSEMREIFGPRDPELDEKELGDDVVRTGVGIAIVLAVGGLLFLIAVVLAIVMGVRSSRRRQSRTPPPWPPVVRSGDAPPNW
jgi:hypothetical protein